MPKDVVQIGRAGNSAGEKTTVGATCPLPLFAARIEAGFPSPADDYLEGALDLNQRLIKRPAATFFLRVSGNSMTGAGIFPGDLLIVDKSVTPADGMIVIAVIDGEMTVKRLYRRRGRLRLLAENPAYRPINIGGEQDLHIWGVVIHAVRSFA